MTGNINLTTVKFDIKLMEKNAMSARILTDIKQKNNSYFAFHKKLWIGLKISLSGLGPEGREFESLCSDHLIQGF